MEERSLLKFKTTVPFPLLIYKVNVKYNEVRKASGVAYILLDLIDKTAGSEEKIGDVLLKFGIPRDLHYIFGQEIANLIGTEILSSRYERSYFLNQKYFAEMLIRDVALTEKGRKLFKEGAIPTGAERVKTKDIFYSPVTRKFDVSYPLPYTTLESSALFEDIDSFLTKTIDISGLTDYVEANPVKMGLKAEERVTKVENPEDGQKMQVRKEDGIQVTVTANGVEFSFDTSDETAYFNKWYSSVLMTKCLLAKEKYKFVNELKDTVKVPTVSLSELTGIVGAYIPNDVSKQAKRPCKIFIDSGKLATGRTDNVLTMSRDFSERLLTKIGGNADFALLDSSALHYYSALNVTMPCKQLNDTFEMQLLTERILGEDAYKELVNDIFEFYIQKNFDGDVAKVVLFAVDALDDVSYFDKAIAVLFEKAKAVDERIGVILKLNDAFSKNNAWKEHFARLATKLLHESVGEIKIDNVVYKSTVLEPLRKALGINDFDYVAQFASELVKTEEKDIIFEALLSAGFGVDAVLSVANVVEDFAQKAANNEEIYSDSDLGIRFHNLGGNLWKLNAMLGIESFSEYTLKDDYNEDEFFNAYATLKSAYKSIEKYERYAPKQYEIIKRYMAIYEPVHDLLSIERSSSSHPEKITKKYIDEYISRGKYKEAICDLLVKLQYDLREQLGAEATVSAHDLIAMARDEGIVDGKQESALHKLRMCRNGFQHPERSQVKFDRETVENWRDTVFAIKGE